MSDGAESKGRTIAFAAGVAFFCSLLVSTAVYFLRPLAAAYEAIDLNRAVLEAAGLLSDGADDRAVVSAFLDLETRVVDLATGEFTAAVDAAGLGFRAAIDQPGQLVGIPPALDTAGLGTRPQFAAVQLLRDEDDGIERIVLPIYARGMWSTIHAVVALESDFSTIAGIAIYAHGETPGIGDRIESAAWREAWVGKQIYDPGLAFRFRVGREAGAQSPQHAVDSITGATVTANAVGDAMRYWFSDHGYAPLLRRLRRQAE